MLGSGVLNVQKWVHNLDAPVLFAWSKADLEGNPSRLRNSQRLLVHILDQRKPPRLLFSGVRGAFEPPD